MFGGALLLNSSRSFKKSGNVRLFNQRYGTSAYVVPESNVKTYYASCDFKGSYY